MTEKFEHLSLPSYEKGFDRSKKSGFSKPILRTDEEKKETSEIQIQQFANLKKSFAQDKIRYREYFDPNLIFKLEIITKSVHEDTLRQDLNRMDIEVLSPAPDKKGLWVVFTEDEEAKKFHEKLDLYVTQNQKKDLFSTLGEIVEIPPEDKIGERLKQEHLSIQETAYLDVEIWRMEDDRLNKFIDGLEKLIRDRDGRITDRLIKQSFCLLRIKANKNIVDELLPLREIASIDRPPQPYITYQLLSKPLEAVNIGKPPPDNATAIAILDSGILSNHPLLQNAVGDEIAVGTHNSNKIDANKPVDDVGHGTKVSGIAVYGDIKQCIADEVFQPEVWILSAKIMYGEENPITGRLEAKYDEEELLEHQLERAIRQCKQHKNCKVVNLSLGNDYKKMFGHKKQFNLAALIDELAKALKLIFVVSTGNFGDYKHKGFPDNYPIYLLEDNEDVKIIDPASSVLSITVGSIAQQYGPLNRPQQDMFFSPVSTHYPSPFTRVGPGYQGMIKPEVVEEGGNIIEKKQGIIPDLGGNLITLNPKWLSDGRLFSTDCGTSFSTPKVANYLARLYNKYPHFSPNLIKALFLSSTQIPKPKDRPSLLSNIKFDSSDKELIELLQIYGYGKPNLDKALFSTENRALLIKDGTLKLNGIDVYYFYLPPEFINVAGRKKLSVTLVYDPPVNKNRIDYMGCSVEFHLFKNTEADEFVKNYNPIAKALRTDTLSDEDIVPQPFKNKEVKLHPGVNLRKKGVHQKGIVEYKGKPKLDTNKPLVLVVICQDRWINKLKDDNYIQDYAVVVTVEHEMNIDLLNKIKIKNQARIRTRLTT